MTNRAGRFTIYRDELDRACGRRLERLGEALECDRGRHRNPDHTLYEPDDLYRERIRKAAIACGEYDNRTTAEADMVGDYGLEEIKLLTSGRAKLAAKLAETEAELSSVTEQRDAREHSLACLWEKHWKLSEAYDQERFEHAKTRALVSRPIMYVSNEPLEAPRRVIGTVHGRVAGVAADLSEIFVLTKDGDTIKAYVPRTRVPQLNQRVEITIEEVE